MSDRNVPGGVFGGLPRRGLGDESRYDPTHDPATMVNPRDNPIPYQTPWQGGPDAPSAVNSGPTQGRIGGAVATKENRLVLPYGEVRVAGVQFRPMIGDGTGGSLFMAWGAGPIEEITNVRSAGQIRTWSRTDFLGTWDNGGTPIANLDRINPLALLPFVAGSVLHVPIDNAEDISEAAADIKGRWCYDPRENRFTNNADLSTDWFSDYAGPDVVTSGQADPWGTTTATKLHFPAGAVNDYFRTYTVATVAGQERTVEVWVKAVGANVTGSLDCVNVLTGAEVESRSTSFVATTNRWRKIKATLTAALTGDAISLRLTFPAAAVAPELLVFCPGLSLKGFSGGSTPTAGTEVVPTFAYTDNLALVALDVLCSCVDAGNIEGNEFPLGGNPLGRDDFTPRHVDVESFGEAARVAPPVSIVFSDRLDLRQAISRLRMAGLADIHFYRGRLRIDIDALHAEDPEIVFASNQVHNPAFPNNCKELKISRLSAVDRPTRVAVTFNDKNANWDQNTVASEDPGVKAGTVPMREAQYTNMDGVATVLQAMTVASWIRRVAKRSLRATFKCSPVGILLRRYQLIRIVASQTIVQSDGVEFTEDIDQEFLVTNFERLPDGTFACSAREYHDDIYDVDENADGDIVPDPQPGSTVPPVVRPISDDSFVVGVSPARDYEDITAYPTGQWAAGSVTGFDGTKINDEILTVSAGDFTAAADSTVRLDAGAAIAFGGARIALAVDSIPAGWLFEYSSDDSAWTAVTNLFKRPTDEATAGFWAEWEEHDTIPSARYWRLRKGSAVAGTEVIRELQFRAYRALYPYSAKVRVKSVAGVKLKDFDAAMARQSLALAEFAVESVSTSGPVKTLDVVLYNVSGKGVESIGVRVTKVVALGTPLDTTQAVVRMLAVDHTTHRATWQLGCLYDDSTRYGAGYWTLTNVGAGSDLSKINDGVTTVKAFDANAAGATIAELNITSEPRAFCAVDIIVPAGTKLFTDHTQSGTYPGGPSPTPGAGPLGVWAAEFWDGAAWVRPPQTIKTNSTVVTYSAHGTPVDAPPAATWKADKYQITASRIRIEWDPQLYSTARDKWRITQTTTDAIALDVYEIQWLTFTRWIAGVRAFGVYAGLVASSAGATQATDGGVITPTGKSVAVGVVQADAPALNVDYSFTSASLAAGTVRRTAWHGPTGPFYFEAIGWLDEVTVIPFLEAAEGPALVEGTARFAWDYEHTFVAGDWNL